jgi:hypothetical protein
VPAVVGRRLNEGLGVIAGRRPRIVLKKQS